MSNSFGGRDSSCPGAVMDWMIVMIRCYLAAARWQYGKKAILIAMLCKERYQYDMSRYLVYNELVGQ